MKFYKKCYKAIQVYELKNLIGDFRIAVDCIPVPQVSLQTSFENLVDAINQEVNLYLVIGNEYNLEKVETFIENHDFEFTNSIPEKVYLHIGLFEREFKCPKIHQEKFSQIYP